MSTKTSDLIAGLEAELARRYGRRHCRFVGRGAVAVYLALAASGRRSGRVIVPANICLSPVNAILYAGFEPLFCDISLTDFNIDPAALEALLKQTRDVAAVLLPHIYGQPTDIDTTTRLAGDYGVLLIEDVAQAMGGRYKERALGSFGDFSILSFGHTKIIDVGGGGALLFDDDRYAAPIEEGLSVLPEKIAGYRELADKYHRVYYGLQELAAGDPSLGRLWLGFPDIFRDLYLFRDLDGKIAGRARNALDTLEQEVAARHAAAIYYRSHLSHEAIAHPDYRWDGVYWRYSFIIKRDNQTEIARRIRELGVLVSNWYPPVHLFYARRPAGLPNAEYLGSHIFNLWTESGYTELDREKAVAAVLEAIEDDE